MSDKIKITLMVIAVLVITAVCLWLGWMTIPFGYEA